MHKEATVKERPILFSAPMVRAILARRKTQTRRIVKFDAAHRVRHGGRSWHSDDPDVVLGCPYGRVGDRLYVRETWAASHDYDRLPPRLISSSATIHYAATESLDGLVRRAAIHMPRWASRLTLEITGVRLERVQAITEADARAEGVRDRAAFEALWAEIHGPDAWDANPWVWVVAFRLVHSA